MQIALLIKDTAKKSNLIKSNRIKCWSFSDEGEGSVYLAKKIFRRRQSTITAWNQAKHVKKIPGFHELSNLRWHQPYMRLVNFFFQSSKFLRRERHHFQNFFGKFNFSLLLVHVYSSINIDLRIDFLCNESPRPTIVIKSEKKKEKKKTKKDKKWTRLSPGLVAAYREKLSGTRKFGPPSQCIHIMSIYFSFKKNSWF